MPVTVAASRYLLRSMALADIPRVSEIERESFPTMWPQTAYKREIQRNNLAAYLVVCERGASQSVAAHPQPGQAPGSSRLGRTVRRLFGRRTFEEPASAVEPAAQIVGFVGVWFMVDEAHIVTIAVARAYRRRGLGEMLLIAAIELAGRREQSAMTLECRVSNDAAQALYEKYGFRRVGVRKRYYTDNNDDALIMTTFPIRTPEYQAEFERLRAAHAARWGTPEVAHPEL